MRRNRRIRCTRPDCTTTPTRTSLDRVAWCDFDTPPDAFVRFGPSQSPWVRDRAIRRYLRAHGEDTAAVRVSWPAVFVVACLVVVGVSLWAAS